MVFAGILVEPLHLAMWVVVCPDVAERADAWVCITGNPDSFSDTVPPTQD